MLTKYSLENIRTLINNNNLEEALDLLDRIGDSSMWFHNAKGVCLMRLGRANEAVKVLTPIVYLKGSVTPDSGTPDKIKLNLAHAMLLVGNVAGAESLLKEIEGFEESKDRLYSTIKKWKKTLPIWMRIKASLYAMPCGEPVKMEGTVGLP